MRWEKLYWKHHPSNSTRNPNAQCCRYLEYTYIARAQAAHSTQLPTGLPLSSARIAKLRSNPPLLFPSVAKCCHIKKLAESYYVASRNVHNETPYAAARRHVTGPRLRIPTS